MIRIRCQDIGGGFGNKVPVYPDYVCAIAGSIVAGVPVKWVENRSENLVSTGFARDYLMRAEICAKDGRPPACGSTRSPTTGPSTPPPSRPSSRPGSSTSSAAPTTSRPRT